MEKTVFVRIPAPLRSHTQGAAVVQARGETVGHVLQALAIAHDGLIQRVMTPAGAPRQFVNLFLDGERVGQDGMLNQPVREGSELAIIPAVAGG